MKDYYTLFVELSLKQCQMNDYVDKRKVKIHNAASKKLKLLQNQMKQTAREDVLYMLLSHEDDRVRINAVSLCLQMNTFVDQAIPILENIIATSTDPTIRFSAKRILGLQGDGLREP